MIIAAYAGCGKTTLAKQCPDKFVEVASMPFARVLPVVKEELTGRFEQEKAAEYHVDNPMYPLNMIAKILEMEKQYKYIIIPTAYSVIKHLQEDYNRSVILCYPEDDLEEEYRMRYLERGNTETFCEIFADGMKDFLEGLKKNEDAYHIRLRSGEFLADKVNEFEDICREFPLTICPDEKILRLREYLKERKKEIWLHYFYFDEVIYRVKDIDNPAEQLFIYMLAKKAYEATEFRCIYISAADLSKDEFYCRDEKRPRIVGKVELWEAVENDICRTEKFRKKNSL